MKRMTCEMCGSTNLVKKEGLFECQDCGTKYSVEEAKKMMVEVDGTVEVTGTVKVDSSNQLDNLLKNIETLYDDGKYEEVYKKCDEILVIDPENPKAMLYKGFADAWNNTNGRSNNIYAAIRGFDRAASSAKKRGQKESIGEFIKFASSNMNPLVLAIKSLYGKICSTEIQSNGRLAQMEARFIGTSYSRADAKEHERKSNEYMAKSNAALEDLKKKLNGLFSTANDLAENMINVIDEPADYDDSVFSAIRMHIFVYKDAKDLTDYSVKTRCNKLMDRVSDLEARANETRVARYWESHADEKESIDKEIRELEAEIESANEQLKTFQPRIDEINAKKNSNISMEQEISRMKDQVRDLSNERARLGIFQGKRKKEINETITRIESEVSEKEKEYKRIKEESDARINQEMSEVEKQCKPFKDKIAEANNRKQELQGKLNKPF